MMSNTFYILSDGDKKVEIVNIQKLLPEQEGGQSVYKIKKKRVKKITQKLKAAGDGGNKNESGARLKQPSDAELEEYLNNN